MQPSERARDERRGHATAEPAIVVASLLTLLGAAAVILLIGPRGDFPLNDDWSYAWAARELCHEGRLRLLQWTGASVVAQVGYGALLCRLFGFSFTVLRASTLALAVVGVFAWQALLRRLGVGGGMLVVATLLVALDPLYVNLAFTYMTDVPFTVCCILAGWWYVRGLEERRAGALLAGSVLAAAAFLIRQHGILVVAAAAIAILIWDDRPLAQRLSAVASAVFVPCVAFVAYHAWLFGVHGVTSAYTNKIGEARAITPQMIVNCAFRGIQYLGLLTAPLAPALLRDALARRRLQLAAWTTALALGAAVLWLREGALLFHLPNVLYDFGVGPVSLRDTHVLGMPPPTRLGLALRVPLTIVATLSAAALCTAATAAIAALRPFARDSSIHRQRRAVGGDQPDQAANRGPAGAAANRGRDESSPHVARAGEAFLVLSALLLFAGTLLQSRYYFDRYLLPVLPFAVAAVVGRVPMRRPSGIEVALVAALAWLAVAGTHDYLAWNRARFAGLAELERAGVTAREIDGGFEYNAWHLAPELGHWPSDEEVRVGQAADRRSWWWVVDDRYIVSFRELPGYAVHAVVPFTRWLVPGSGEIFILERAS